MTRRPVHVTHTPPGWSWHCHWCTHYGDPFACQVDAIRAGLVHLAWHRVGVCS